ncbi:unnamed protein product [Calypogeia fissa]
MLVVFPWVKSEEAGAGKRPKSDSGLPDGVLQPERVGWFPYCSHDENKMAVGVLGAIRPLTHLLKWKAWGQEESRHGMTLYHLS